MSDTNQPATAGPTKTETLAGGSEREVTYKTGKSEFVFVRQVPISEYPAYLKVVDDECALIELCTGNPSGYAATLAPISHEAMVEEIERINGDFFSRWVDRRLKRQERLVPGFRERALAAAVQPSPTLSPNSPSKPA